MEINVKRLREALELIGPAVPKKHTLPVTLFIRLGEGQAIATDLMVAVTLSLPEAEGMPVLLPIKQARDFLDYIPGHETAHIEVAKGHVTITANSMNARYEVPDAMDFPPIPSVKAEGEGVLDGDALLRALEAVRPYTATEDSRPVLTDICLTPGDAVEAAAADGFRLAWENVPGKLAGEKPLLIPSGAVHILAHLWKRCARPETADISDPARLAMAKRFMRLEWGKDLLQFNFGEVRLLVTLGSQGNFPNYRQLIPTEAAPSVTIMAEDMERVLHQLKAIAKSGSGIVRLVWESDRLILSAKDEEVSEARVEVGASCSAPGRTAVNFNYLVAYFKGKTGAVTFSTAGPSNPVVFAYRGMPHVVMMPMFVEWGDGAAPTAPSPEGPAEDTWIPETADIPEDTPEVEPEAEIPKPKGRRKKKG